MSNLVDLPDIVLVHIFSYLSYDTVAQNRIVCKCFNDVGSRILNKGFHAAEKLNNKCFREIKAKLPRRESERRNHPLTKHCEIFSSIETRINMLGMTFSRWINNNVCCFIPGKVLDEIFRVLRSLPTACSDNCTLPKAKVLEMLQELRDLSSMAMEHFDDKILPQLKRNFYRSRTAEMLECSRRSIGVRDDGRSRRWMGCRFNGLTLNHYLLPLTVSPDSRESSPPPQLSPPAKPSISQSEYQRLIVLNSIMRKKLQAQSMMIANQTREMSELRMQVEAIQRAINSPLMPQQLLKSPDLLLAAPKRSRPESLIDEDSPSSSKVSRMSSNVDSFLDN